MTPSKGYAAQSSTSPLAPWAFERRDVGPTDVQFDILFCGVCHSDIHSVRSEWAPGIFPMVPGHEIVGRITKTGDAVTKFDVGDLAAVGCLVDSCRHCENCAEGLEQYCRNAVGTYNALGKDNLPTYGGYSNNLIVHEYFACHVADNLHLPAVAPLLCAGITTYSPLRHWKVGPGHKLAVLGLGGLGHMAVKFGAAFGAEVTVLTTSAGKAQDAKRLGAHQTIVTTNRADTKPYRGYFDFIIDTVSAPHDFRNYLSLLHTDGTHILVGLPPKPLEIPPFSLTNGRRSVAGSSIGGLPETQEMLDFCSANNIVCDIETIDIKDINKAYDRMMVGDVKYRFVIDMATL